MAVTPAPPGFVISQGGDDPSEVEQMNIQNNVSLAARLRKLAFEACVCNGDLQLQRDRFRNGEDASHNSSSPSVGFFGRIIFQKMLILSLGRLIIYIYKLYEDANSVNEYYSSWEVNFLIISACSLAVPPLFYAIYLVGSNLAKDDILDKTEISTKTVNGILLIPWQIKRHLDGLHFAAQRVCEWRRAEPHEEADMNAMQRNAEILEFFEDFYAGFLQIILQIYIYLGTTNFVSSHTVSAKFRKLSACYVGFGNYGLRANVASTRV